MRHLALLVALTAPALAQEPQCPIPEQKPTIVTRLYFGQTIGQDGHVAPAAWHDFLKRIVTPRFPQGFTVYDGTGQWQGKSERTKIVEIAAEDEPAIRARIAEVARLYRERFHQDAVGIVSTRSCAAF